MYDSTRVKKISKTEDKKSSSNILNTARYNNRIVHSIDELIENIKLFPNIKRINLIDYENICDNKLLIQNHIIDDDNVINIFFFNACIYSNNYYSLIKDSKSINLQIISLEVANQLIDHLLIFYLGALVARYPGKKYKIYSRDSGYYPFITNLNYSNVKICSLTKPIKRGYKYSLGKYILNNPDITESKYFTKTDFIGLFKEFYPNRTFNSRTISSIIGELTKFEFISNVKMDSKKYYRFCLKKISEYVEFIDSKIV